jgi:AraC-like DNA-binding protein
MKTAKWFKRFYRNPPGSGNFVINGIGVREIMRPGIVNRPGGTGDSLLMFFYNKTVVNIQSEYRTIEAGSMVYWEKCGHYYGNTDSKWMHSWIHFDGSEAHSIVKHAGLQPFTIIRPAADMLEKLLTEIDREISMAGPDMLILRDRFEILVREIARSGKNSGNPLEIPERMIAVKRYLEDNYRRDLSLAGIARQFSVSPPHLSAEFKRCFGLSPVRYVIEYRLQEAELLLKDNNLQIAEIAEKVGWNDVYHFSKIFKRHRGVPPSAMRSKSPDG